MDSDSQTSMERYLRQERRAATEFTEQIVWQAILCWKALCSQKGRRRRSEEKKRIPPQSRRERTKKGVET